MEQNANEVEPASGKTQRFERGHCRSRFDATQADLPSALD